MPHAVEKFVRDVVEFDIIGEGRTKREMIAFLLGKNFRVERFDVVHGDVGEGNNEGKRTGEVRRIFGMQSSDVSFRIVQFERSTRDGRAEDELAIGNNEISRRNGVHRRRGNVHRIVTLTLTVVHQ